MNNRSNDYKKRIVFPFNVSLIVIGCIIIGYIIMFAFPSLYDKLHFVPYYIMYEHQYWRLISWIFTAPFGLGSFLSFIFLPICLYFYYSIGNTLEMVWGRRQLVLFLLTSVILTDVCVMVSAFIVARINQALLMDFVMSPMYYLILSMYLAFAYINPDMQVMLYFVIPLKMKWLAIIDIVYIAYMFIVCGSLFTRVTIICFVATFGLFFFVDHAKGSGLKSVKKHADMRRNFRKAAYKAEAERNMKRNIREMQKNTGKEGYDPDSTYSEVDKLARKPFNPDNSKYKDTKTIHRCAVCGITEKDDPEMEFRYCSKCNGNLEYCREHLFTHEHVKW